MGASIKSFFFGYYMLQVKFCRVCTLCSLIEFYYELSPLVFVIHFGLWVLIFGFAVCNTVFISVSSCAAFVVVPNLLCTVVLKWSFWYLWGMVSFLYTLEFIHGTFSPCMYWCDCLYILGIANYYAASLSHTLHGQMLWITSLCSFTVPWSKVHILSCTATEDPSNKMALCHLT